MLIIDYVSLASPCKLIFRNDLKPTAAWKEGDQSKNRWNIWEKQDL